MTSVSLRRRVFRAARRRPIERGRSALLLATLFVLPWTVPGASAARSGPLVEPSPSYYYATRYVALPNFAPLSSYVYNDYGSQYPVYDFGGRYAGDILYVDTSSRLAWYDPANGTSGELSQPLPLLYQTTPGIEGQIDNEFQLDTPYPVALFYGNLSTKPGHVTVETVDLDNGTIRLVTTPVLMENGLQADYVGNGLVAVFNATNSRGYPTYLVNMYNGTSWYAGADVGIAPNNIYWVAQLSSFIDVQGSRVNQYRLENDSLRLSASVWFNNSSVRSITAVNGAVYDPSDGRLAFWDSTNAGWFYTILNTTTNGSITVRGSYSYFSDYLIYVERYCYTSPYVWAVDSPPPSLVGPTVLFSPFNNSTIRVPSFMTRYAGSGGSSNYELQDPYSTTVVGSLNGSLVGAPYLAPGEIVWAEQGPPPPATNQSLGGNPSDGGALYELEGRWYFWAGGGALSVGGGIAVVYLIPPTPRARKGGDR